MDKTKRRARLRATALPRERQQLADLVAFSKVPEAAWAAMPKAEQLRWAQLVLVIASLSGFYEDAPGEPDYPPAAELAELSRFIRQLLEQQVVALPEIHVQRLAGAWRPRGNRSDLFKHNAYFRVLTSRWVRECRHCGRVFVAQKSGAYCSQQHAQVAGTRRYRARLKQQAAARQARKRTQRKGDK